MQGIKNVLNILEVTDIKSYTLIAFGQALQDVSYNIISIPADVDAFSGVTEPLTAILIYAVDRIPKPQVWHLIKDYAISENIPIFLLGNQDSIDQVRSFIPSYCICQAFVRPVTVHVSLLAKQTDQLIKRHRTLKKILLVDDSGVWLRNVKGWLEEKYRVFLANSAAMAIKHIAMNRPDLILLDYDMPVVDGLKVLEMIRTETEFSSIPVIFLTNMGDVESIRKVMELRPEGYLLKSMQPFEIVKAVDDFFQLQTATRANI